MSLRRKRNSDEDDYSQPGPSQRQKKVANFKSASQGSENEQSESEPQDFSQSQASLSTEARDEISNTAVIKILAHNNTLRPFKRSDILHNTKAKGKVANEVMTEVKKKLFDVS